MCALKKKVPSEAQEAARDKQNLYTKLPGAIMGGPARDEVMKKIAGRQGHPGPHP